MGIVFELVCFGPAGAVGAARGWHDAAARAWRELPGLLFHDLYVAVPDGAKDPLVDDGPGALLIAMLGFAGEEAGKLVASPALGWCGVYALLWGGGS